MSFRLALARIGFRWRLAAALVCLLLAAVTALEGRAAPAGEATTQPVVVATRVLPAGRVLVASDLRTVRRRDHWPGKLSRIGAAVGRTLAGPVAAGEPVTVLRLVDRSLTSGLPADLVAVPVDVAADVRGLARPGSRIDLLGAPPAADSLTSDGATARVRRVAEGVLVLAVLGPDEGGTGCTLILAIERAAAPGLTAARSTGVFHVAVLPP